MNDQQATDLGKPPSPYACYLALKGGMATVRGGLGVVVAPQCEESILNCPPGWTFLALEEATAQRVQDALDAANWRRGKAEADSDE